MTPGAVLYLLWAVVCAIGVPCLVWAVATGQLRKGRRV